MWQVKSQSAPPILPFIKVKFKRKDAIKTYPNKTPFSTRLVMLIFYLFSSFLPQALYNKHSQSFPVLKKAFTWICWCQDKCVSSSICMHLRCLRPCAHMPGAEWNCFPRSSWPNRHQIQWPGFHHCSWHGHYLMMLSTCGLLKFCLPLLMSLWHFQVILLWGHSPRSSPRPSGFSLWYL